MGPHSDRDEQLLPSPLPIRNDPTTASDQSVSPAEDRDRQLAAAAWILGWIGGPFPALAILMITDGPGWSRQLVRDAAVFWTIMWAVLLGLLYAELTTDVPAFAALWTGVVVIALAVTFVAARMALRRSQRSLHRRPW